MLIADTSFQDRQRWRKTVDATRALAQGALAEQKLQVRATRESQTEAGTANPTNPLDQMGRPMTGHQLYGILRKCNSHLLVQDSPTNPNIYALLYPQMERQPDGGEKRVLRFLCAFEKGYMPEFEVLHPQYDTAWDSEKKDFVETLKTVRQTRGWRTVLGRCLQAGLITKQQVREYFSGEPNRASWLKWTKER